MDEDLLCHHPPSLEAAVLLGAKFKVRVLLANAITPPGC